MNCQMNTPINLIQQKWKLASKLTEKLNTPENCFFVTIISRALTELEETYSINNKTLFKNKFIKSIPQEIVKKIEEKFLSEYCDTVLKDMNDEEIYRMKEDFEKTGHISQLFYRTKLDTAINLNKSYILNVVQKEAVIYLSSWYQKKAVFYS
jgi:hypothetical protein